MIEAKMPKDIRVYETKLIGPLTLRQTICLCVAIFVDIILYDINRGPCWTGNDSSFLCQVRKCQNVSKEKFN